MPWITLNGARALILQSLQASLGRQVSCDSVHLHLFPLPGVELDNIRLAEDPAFGAEDMVMAGDAVAAVRILPLFAGRLVFARVELDGPSINLVRNRAGRWNITALLDRVASPRPVTGRTLPPQPFPYLEWSDARINFKFNQTKTRFYLAGVQGSLARDANGWRLQAGFQPERTDLNLSNPGDVTLDGRWPASGGGFRQRPFQLEIRLRNSYLAASTALLAGHDAGVHGVLDALVHVEGPPQPPSGTTLANPPAGFHLSGVFQAHSLRRWDLLPPPATVAGNFSGTYYPDQDRFVLDGLGDPGWRHLRLQGTIDHLFTHPAADLSLGLNQFQATDLLPLAMAIKARLPSDLAASGTVSGSARIRLNSGPRSPAAKPATGATQLDGDLATLGGSADFRLEHFALSSGQDRLQIPAARALWTRGGLRLLAAPSGVRAGTAAVPLVLSARLDPHRFSFGLDSTAFTPPAAAALAHLFGLRLPWPAFTGAARVHLDLAGTWSDFRHSGWKGKASLARARFDPLGSPGGGILLGGVSIVFAEPAPIRIGFQSVLAGPEAGAPAAAGLTGTVLWTGAAAGPLQFHLRARRLDSGAVGAVLHPGYANLVSGAAPGGLVLGFLQRLFGSAAPGWLRHLNARGSVDVSDFTWHGIHTGLRMQLSGGARNWNASSLKLALARGQFEGSGGLANGNVHLAGTVAAAHPLRLALLVAHTPYAGLLAGALSGSLQLSRRFDVADPAAVAAGSFLLRGGRLATRTGEIAFDRLSGSFTLDRGTLVFTHLRLNAGGARWTGEGTAQLPAPHAVAGPGVSFDLRLKRPGHVLRLRPPLAPARRLPAPATLKAQR